MVHRPGMLWRGTVQRAPTVASRSLVARPRGLSSVSSGGTPQNLTEKIVQRFALDSAPAGAQQKPVLAGDYLTIAPRHILTHDNTAAVMKKFDQLFPPAVSKRVRYHRQPVFALDHNVQDRSADNLKKYAEIEAFARLHGVDFFPAGRGIGHQIMCEEGYAWPGTLVMASDSHANMYGALGCLGTPVVRTDAAAIWATGSTWWQVPPVARVSLTGRLPPGASGKDVVIVLCGLFSRDEVLNHAIEFSGDGVASLTIEERMTIANMTTEWGALTGLFPIDSLLLDWVRQRSESLHRQRYAGGAAGNRFSHAAVADMCAEAALGAEGGFVADQGARYAKELTLDLSSISPHVSGPNQVKAMSSVRELEAKRIAIDKAYIVSCVNSRVDDLAQAAAVLRDKHISPSVELYIAAASSQVQEESERRGDWKALVAAGARVLPPGCGPCIGLGTGLLRDGEVGISATNRNFRGRMGSSKAQAYLASPAVVAASALAGYIAAPKFADSLAPTERAPAGMVLPGATAAASSGSSRSSGGGDGDGDVNGVVASVPLLAGFPGEISGALVFCHEDNLNTDAIYAGRYTYVENMSPEEQAAVVMQNYDPSFATSVPSGAVLVGGFNFGTGSSREQAATALKYKGISAVVAGSFSETYKRNAINNGFLCIEQPQLVRDLKAALGESQATVLTSKPVRLLFASSQLLYEGQTYNFDAVGPAAQNLVMFGGQDAFVKHKLSLTAPA